MSEDTKLIPKETKSVVPEKVQEYWDQYFQYAPILKKNEDNYIIAQHFIYQQMKKNETSAEPNLYLVEFLSILSYLRSERPLCRLIWDDSTNEGTVYKLGVETSTPDSLAEICNKLGGMISPTKASVFMIYDLVKDYVVTPTSTALFLRVAFR